MNNSRRNRIGSNQYKAKYKGFTTRQQAISAIFLVIILMGIFNSLFPTTIEARDNMAEMVSPVAGPAGSMRDVVITEKEATPAATSEYSQEDIERYIKTIFREDAKVAIAVSHNECGPTNRLYPKCNLHTTVENSVGLFQINIESATAKIHWGRIPGDTLQDKKTWLENPYNNTLLAYWIFQNSGWNPWSAYTSGRYLRSL